MGDVNISMGDDYWGNFSLNDEDIEFLYNHLMETETPLTSNELIEALIKDRIERRRREVEKQRMAAGDLYQPKLAFSINQKLIFPALNWHKGEVVQIRPGVNPEIGDFEVIQVIMDDGSKREFASSLANHKLNAPPKVADEFRHLEVSSVLQSYGDNLVISLERALIANDDFVRIAGRWFPRTLLVDINLGHLNIAEAVLDMASGGPLPTRALLEQLEFTSEVNPKLQEFSMDLALQEDPRFDEVGPSGDVLWFLKRLEPSEVTTPPVFLRYQEIDHDRSLLTPEMLVLEKEIDDELSPIKQKFADLDDVEVRLIFPHWRAGTLPLNNHTAHLFPTAYEAPRVRFMLVDGETGATFPGWVARDNCYVYGLEEWYESHGVIPGSIVHVQKGQKPGEAVVHIDNHRPTREWVRTLLVGSDGGIVYAMLKQVVSVPVDERMAIAIPDKMALDATWLKPLKDQQPFEKLVVNTMRDLARLNPQGNIHLSELYSAINIVRRVPPAPIMALLASRPWFVHIGDMNYRLSDMDTD